MTMDSFDDLATKLTAPGPDRQLPGCIVVACKDGEIHYKSFGTQSLDPDSPLSTKPLDLDTTMWIASCTKLVTSISVLQCVERGLLDLDADFSLLFPEWAHPQILQGWDAATGEPVLAPATRKITLRTLLSHSSGMGYHVFNPSLQRYRAHLEAQPGTETPLDWLHPLPLLFEPGTSWEYGVGLDWAGRAVEAATGQSLGAHMQQHIFAPLGMTSTTFRLASRPDMQLRRADMSVRDGTSPPGAIAHRPGEVAVSARTDREYGGMGLWSCARDYTRLLVALLQQPPSESNKLLSASSLALLFHPALSKEKAQPYFQQLRDRRNADYEGTEMALPAPVALSHALGGMVTLADVPGGRKAGSLSWGGMPNLSWCVDREGGVAFFYGSQLLPPGDGVTQRVLRAFEKAVYEGSFVVGAQRVDL